MGAWAHWGLEDWRHRVGAVGFPCYHAGRQPHLPLLAPLYLPEAPHCSYQVSNLVMAGEMCCLCYNNNSNKKVALQLMMS